jgi:uridylate kinase
MKNSEEARYFLHETVAAEMCDRENDLEQPASVTEYTRISWMDAEDMALRILDVSATKCAEHEIDARDLTLTIFATTESPGLSRVFQGLGIGQKA